MGNKTRVFLPELWLRAWCASVQSGKDPWEAANNADTCLKQFKEKFGEKEETK
jgi:hypothetical protein